MERPAFKSSWPLRQSVPEACLMASEKEMRLLHGRLYERLVPLIDGTRTPREIARELGDIPEHEVTRALAELDNSGLLADTPALVPEEAAFWELLGAGTAEVELRRAHAAAEVISMDGDAEGVCEALHALGIPVAAGAPFRIVITEDYLDDSLETYNTDALRNGTPWMLAKPYGRWQWLGPLFVPDRTACWRCLAHRLHLNGWMPAGLASLPTTSAVTRTLLATEAAKFLLTGANGTIEGGICEIDTGALGIRKHVIMRRPQCAACGPHPAQECTVATLGEHVSALTGIVSSVMCVRSEPGFSIYAAECSQILRPDRTGKLFYSRREATAGKGATEAEARTGALAEAMERYSAQFHGDEPRVTASLRELGTRAVDPERLMQISAEQYRTRERWNARGDDIHWVSERFDAEKPIEWTEARSAISRRKLYVPAAYCYMGYGEVFCAADSNGCAAGSTFEAAVLRGFLELVERDAVALWWYNRARRPEIDLKRFESGRIADIAALIRQQHRDLHVLDLTTEFRIPVFAAVSSRPDGSSALVGTGAGMDAEVALWQALAELAVLQCSPRRKGMTRVSLANHAHLKPRGRAKHSDSAKDWKDCIERARTLGMDVLVVNLTRPEIGLPVARVIVPGLCHWRPRFGAPRLCVAPVSLGWQKRRLREEELGPAPFFI